MIRRSSIALAAFALLTGTAAADPLSRQTEIDFFRDVPSRNLKGLAARSDGRLVAGPTLTELTGAAPADLLWALEPTTDPAKWLVGTGPDGKIFEVTIDAAKGSFASREIAKLDESHVFALARLPDGSLLAGTSPKGALCLVRDGKIAARVALPVDSILDIFLRDEATALIATGNPGRIYEVDLKKFAASPVVADKITDAKLLAERGIRLFGEIRDRNVRRITRLSDGRIAAGSSPKGNVYTFAADGGPAVILQENRDGEVTDLLPTPDGGLYATVTFAGGSGEGRITPSKGPKEPVDVPAPLAAERFAGRSALVWFPPNGFPEVVAARANAAFYRIARQGDVLLLTGGEQGEMLGYDVSQRLSLTFAGSVSSQLNELAPVPGQPGQFLILRNNAPGFALLDFSASTPRDAETRRIDLGNPSTIGAVRFNRLRNVADPQLTLEMKTSNGSDEIEGWSSWIPLKASDGGWRTTEARGRYLKLRVKLPPKSDPHLELDKASVYALPQNRRPQLQDFHVLSANYGLIAATEVPTPPVVSVGQLLQNKEEDPKRKNAFLSSQIVPTPGAQVVIWTVNDPDGDNVVCTFSLRRDGDTAWTDVALNTHETFAQFDISHLPDGIYFTRLVAAETDPRLPADRLSSTFETDDLVVDHTPPEIIEASAKRVGDRLVISVRGHDALSLVDGIEAVFNSGLREQTEQPADGIRDSREETFVLDVPLARAAGATSVEVSFFAAAGNSSAKRLTW